VGTVVTGHRTLASNLADSGHVYSPKIKLARASYGVSAPRQALQPGHRIVLSELSIARPKCQTRDSQRWRSIRWLGGVLKSRTDKDPDGSPEI